MLDSRLDIIPATDTEHWHGVLSKTDNYDFYHLPEYHQLAEWNGEGSGVLLAYQETALVAAWPFLLRSLEMVKGLERVGKGLRDATSVYGYPGPICSSGVRKNTEFISRFGVALQSAAQDLRLASMFSRLNPLLENADLARSVGTVVDLGQTVYIDLAVDPEVQWFRYKKDIRYDLNRARREGVRAYRDPEWAAFDEFIRLYTATMERVGAGQHYFWDRDYFLRLREGLGERLQLFVAELDGVVCSAGLFAHTGDIVQHHLDGSDPGYAKLDVSKLVIDEARVWGNAVGARFLHLGGGKGSTEDSVFWHKARFSPLRRGFSVWKWIALPAEYGQLADARRAWLKERGGDLPATGYFPLYRAG